MAKVTMQFPDELLKKLSDLDNRTDEITKKALIAGGRIALRYVRGQLRAVVGNGTKYKVRSTGELARSLGLSPPDLDGKDNWNVKVGFHEPRKRQPVLTCKGMRYTKSSKRSYNELTNAMIAKVIEYGKHGQPAKPFLARAKRRLKKPCEAAMKQKFEEEVKKL